MLYAVSPLRRADGRRGAVRRARALPHGRRHELHGRRRLERRELDDVVAEIAATRSPSAARRARTTGSARRRWRTARWPATSDVPTPAAPRHRRLGRRRQVDADRAAAATTPRPSWPTSSTHVEAARGAGRRLGPRAADGRPARRARAGHHDRRRLPLLRDAAAALHHRRHARPRAVHAQHGHGRLDGGRAPIVLVDARKGVIEQTRRHASIASLLGVPHLVVAREQDGPRRLGRGGLRRDRARVRACAHAARRRRRHLHADQRAARRQRRRALGSDALVRRAAAARAPRDASSVAADRSRRRRCACPCSSCCATDGTEFRGYAGQVAGGAVQPGRRGRRPARRHADDRRQRADARRGARRGRRRRCR